MFFKKEMLHILLGLNLKELVVPSFSPCTFSSFPSRDTPLHFITQLGALQAEKKPQKGSAGAAPTREGRLGILSVYWHYVEFAESSPSSRQH